MSRRGASLQMGTFTGSCPGPWGIGEDGSCQAEFPGYGRFSRPAPAAVVAVEDAGFVLR